MNQTRTVVKSKNKKKGHLIVKVVKNSSQGKHAYSHHDYYLSDS